MHPRNEQDVAKRLSLFISKRDYGFDLDTSYADDGSYSFGWIEIADTAGNLLENSGSFESPLFNLQISSDGSPQLGYDSLSWNLGPETWLHPGELVSLEIPIWDKNGVTDINHIELDLSFNQPDDSTISWSRSGNSCESSTLYISIKSCILESGSDQNIFSSNGKFIVEFFDPLSSFNCFKFFLLFNLIKKSTSSIK